MPSTILAFGLTPGDIEMGCGGTLAVLAEAGYAVGLVYPSSSCPEPAECRLEAQAAARCLGIGSVHFIPLTENGGIMGQAGVLAAARLIREQRPELIYTLAGSEAAPEALALSCLVATAMTAAADSAAEGLTGEPFTVRTLFSFELKPPLATFRHAVNITPAMDRKLQAIRSYPFLAGKGYDEAMRGLARYRGAVSRAGTFAEVFDILAGEYEPFHTWDE